MIANVLPDKLPSIYGDSENIYDRIHVKDYCKGRLQWHQKNHSVVPGQPEMVEEYHFH